MAWEVWTGGGFMRISYSANGGQSWSTVADVPVAQSYGVVSSGSYQWTLPANLAGQIYVKLDWMAAPGAMALPWAMQNRVVTIVGTRVVPIGPRKHH